MALQHKFDKEAGMRTEKGRQAEGDVGTALRAVLDEEPLYSPLSAHEPECRKSMCRMQYRYSDPSIAEFAATSLLMVLLATFATTALLTLLNDDRSEEHTPEIQSLISIYYALLLSQNKAGQDNYVAQPFMLEQPLTTT